MSQELKYVEVAYSNFTIYRCLLFVIFADITKTMKTEKKFGPAGFLKLIRVLFFFVKQTDKKESNRKRLGPLASFFGRRVMYCVLRYKKIQMTRKSGS